MRIRESYVVKLGGHVLIDDRGKIRKKVFSSYVDLVTNFWREGVSIHTVVGGGRVARLYIELLAALGAPKALQDLMGIEVTKINAKLLTYALRTKGVNALFKDYLFSVDQPGDSIYVMGGVSPAQSTTAVAALLAETIKAVKLIVATDVDGLYSEDPKKNPQATLLRRVTMKELMEILKMESEPGSYKLIDSVALQVIARSKIATHIVNGLNPRNIEKAIRGEEIGTLIAP
ncbi:MAG: UMP kinase [Candidatus Nezhaarchaeales archaeon]|nr:MAG: UMP kinase [Candidatus Nezhaarchaeota archaeon WYZ-LMO8]TDA35105.1 MAG: UMP kinase [Candidatus Nezhaarchaeota archaeon WYZ-LMO7]